MEDKDLAIRQLKEINQRLMNKIAILDKENKSLKLSIFFYTMDIQFLKSILSGYIKPRPKTDYGNLDLNEEDKKFMKDMGIGDEPKTQN